MPLVGAGIPNTNSNGRGLFNVPMADKMTGILFWFPDHWKTEILANLDRFIDKENLLCSYLKWSRLAKSSIFQWSGPLENRTKWQPSCFWTIRKQYFKMFGIPMCSVF